jgi:hypothetical protein
MNLEDFVQANPVRSRCERGNCLRLATTLLDDGRRWCGHCAELEANEPGPADESAPYPFHEVAAEAAALVTRKNVAYGDSFNLAGRFLALLWPEGVPPESFGDMLTMVRMFDKFKRIATDPAAFDEDPRRDVLGYALLWVACREEG